MPDDKKDSKVKMDYFKKMTLIMVIFSAVVVVLFVISILTGMKKRTNSNYTDNNRSSTVNVSVKEMTLEDFSQNIVLSADLKSLRGSVSVYAPVSGTLVKNSIRLGDRVKIGDELGIVDASDIGASYKPSSVIAKSDGIITGVSTVPNQKVTTSSVLYTIEPDPDFVIRASVSESDADSLSLGSLATFTTMGDKETKHTAKLTYIAPLVSPLTRSVEIELIPDDSLANLKGLRNGAFVELSLSKSQVKDALVVPKDCIRSYNNKDVVYIVDGSVAKRVDVEIGLSNQSQAVITKGLNAGDKVIIQGSPQDGDKVQVL